MMHVARARSKWLASQVLTVEPGVQVVQLMDEMSDTLCRCYDAAEACRNIHDDPNWRMAATNVCHELGGYITAVNHDHGMYAALVAALKTAHRPATASPEQPQRQGGGGDGGPPVLADGWDTEALRVGQLLALDMEKAGIHLPPAQRRRMEELMNQSNHYAANFNRALRDPRKLGSVRVRWGTMPLDPGSVSGVLISEADEECREQVWRAAARSPLSNLALLDAMVAARHELATLVQQPSYSHYKAHGNSLAEHPAAIVALLRQLAEHVKPVADGEAQALALVKSRLLGKPSGAPTRLWPWDTEYMMGVAHRQAVGSDTSRSTLQEYTHLPSVLDGLGELMRRVLGLRLEVRPAGERETWAHGVLRCDVFAKDSGHIGTVFLDLCGRPGKYPSAVTFPIVCRRQHADGSYQTPVLALLADFGGPHASPGDVRLSLSELRVLLHEWGHCVHALVSTARYQHVSGTRCAQDLVELPSHLFEHWVADPRSLRVLARHRSTRDPLPSGVAAALTAQRARFSGLELQQQLLLSLVDQALFGERPPPPGGTGEAWRQTIEPYASIPWIPGSHPEARVGHLTIYGATYYSYMYARCLSTLTWDSLFANDPLDPGAGDKLVRDLLQHGGAKDPVTLVQDALGPDALVQHSSGGWAPRTDALLLRSTLAVFG